MFIAKFNRLIKSRLLWGFFLLLIVISFVFWGMRSPGSLREQTAVGRLDGEPVAPDEFNGAYFHAYVALEMMYARLGVPLTVTERLDTELRRAAWRRLVALRTAGKLGILTTDREVAEMIQREPAFCEGGQFSKQKYMAQVRNLQTRGRGMSEVQFEQHLAQETTLRKLRGALAGVALWISPFELRHLLTQYCSEFVIEYAALQMANYTQDVEVTEEKAAAYFDEHHKLFDEPDKVRVRYVSFSYDAFEPEQPPDDQQIEDYYNAHIDKYTNTNAAETATPRPLEDVRDTIVQALRGTEGGDAATNTPSEQAIRQYYDAHLDEFTNQPAAGPIVTPLEQVRGQIVEALADQARKDAAMNKATDFVVELAPDRAGNAAPFEEVAARHGLGVCTSELFAADQVLSNLNVGLAFNEAAFRLEPTDEACFSDAVAGDDAALVLALAERRDAYTPSFDEARARAIPAAVAHYARLAFHEKAEAIRAGLAEAVKSGTSFAQAATNAQLIVERTEPFLAYQGVEGSDYSAELVEIAQKSNPGELAEIVYADSVALIARVASQKPLETPPETLRQQLVQEVSWQRGQQLFSDWEEHLLKQARFEEKAAARPAVEPDESPAEEQPAEELPAEDTAEPEPGTEDAAAPEPAADSDLTDTVATNAPPTPAP